MRNKLMQEALQQVPEHSRVFIQMYTDIIDRIHDLMEEKGYLQKDLANLLDKKESEISKWLKGDHNLTLRTIAKLQVALGEPIVLIPPKKESTNFVSWKKTKTPTMHVDVKKALARRIKTEQTSHSPSKVYKTGAP